LVKSKIVVIDVFFLFVSLLIYFSIFSFDSINCFFLIIKSIFDFLSIMIFFINKLIDVL